MPPTHPNPALYELASQARQLVLERLMALIADSPDPTLLALLIRATTNPILAARTPRPAAATPIPRPTFARRSSGDTGFHPRCSGDTGFQPVSGATPRPFHPSPPTTPTPPPAPSLLPELLAALESDLNNDPDDDDADPDAPLDLSHADLTTLLASILPAPPHQQAPAAPTHASSGGVARPALPRHARPTPAAALLAAAAQPP